MTSTYAAQNPLDWSDTVEQTNSDENAQPCTEHDDPGEEFERVEQALPEQMPTLPNDAKIHFSLLSGYSLDRPFDSAFEKAE